MSVDDLADVAPADKFARPRSPRLQLIAHAIAWGLLLALYIFVVPRIEAVFKDYNIPLPRDTVFVISAAHRIIRYEYLIVASLILIVAGTERLTRATLSDQPNCESCRCLPGLMVVAPLVLIGLTLIALSLPHFGCHMHLDG